MRIKFIIAFLILIFACVLQSWLASMNIFIDVILASLIAFAFFFDIWELLVFILFSIFVINWQPAFSVEILLFGVIPLITFVARKFFALIPWIAIPVAIFCGFLVMYIVVAPSLFFANWQQFVIDVLGALVFGQLVYLALNRSTQ
jgi:hypothetical protein